MSNKTIFVGRLLTAIGILGVGLTLSLLIDPISAWANGSPGVMATLNVVGVLAAFSIFVAWGMAVFHWGRRSFPEPSTKRRWGLAVTFGMFIGAWFYWLAGTCGKDGGTPS